MKKIKKNIAFTGILFLSISALFAGEKSIKLGSGYKVYNLTSHDFHIHSGRYFYGGYSHEFGKQAKQKFQFQTLNVTKTLDYQPMVNAYLKQVSQPTLVLQAQAGSVMRIIIIMMMLQQPA